ncbi:MAG: hypothetical protein KZQ73_15145 [Candidatus Thiodiazotropha sp. (ex Semelilucina semeliformis)]|nr:hypothetical protein [Candidatus Thiodiazotropha sp. (ex Semelilucina semeliformis)]
MRHYQELLLLGLFTAMVTTATAGDIGHDQQSMHQTEREKKSDDSHGHGHMQTLGSQKNGNIQATLGIMPYDKKSQAALKTYGIVATHHVMFSLMNTDTGQDTDHAMVHAWAKTATKNAPKKVRLISMQMSNMAGYGGDINLPSPEVSTIAVEAVTADESVHRFYFQSDF